MRSSGHGAFRGAVFHALVVAAAFTMGCASSTEVLRTWSEPGYKDGSVTNVLVVAMRDDPVKRRIWEDGFVSSLSARHVKATPSYSMFPSALPDTQQVIDATRKNGYDGILVLMRLPDQSRTVTAPGTTRREAATAQDATGKVYTYYQDVYEPGNSTTESLLNFQSDVWRVLPGRSRLVWSAVVRVNESVTGNLVRDAIQGGFMPRLTSSGVVSRR